MPLDDDFAAAQEQVKGLPRTPGPSELLDLYALYKQATVGDVSGARPSRLDFKGRAKYGAWEERKGVAADEAKRQYVALVAQLRQRYSSES